MYTGLCGYRSQTLCFDPRKVEAAITSRTTIMPVHVYGNPCAVEQLQDVADRYGLKIIYDAAHAFGVSIPKAGPCCLMVMFQH